MEEIVQGWPGEGDKKGLNKRESWRGKWGLKISRPTAGPQHVMEGPDPNPVLAGQWLLTPTSIYLGAAL